MENGQPVSITGQEEQQGAGRHYPPTQNPSCHPSASTECMAQENRPRTGSKRVLQYMRDMREAESPTVYSMLFLGCPQS